MRFVRGSHTDNDPAVGKRTLEEALDHGITTIHSSYEYRTRWAVGEVLATHPKRHEVKHIIKAPVPDYEYQGFDPAKFRKLEEEALSELHAERIAIVQHLQRGVPEKHGVPHLLHADALRRKVIEEPYAGEWSLKVKLAFRFREQAL
jgi:aryl-alcohol dehydrogenase-like predicted oxidoreductase